ncbi:MAG: hypothetical protein WBM40_07850 [Thiohalocapsa sp.]
MNQVRIDRAHNHGNIDIDLPLHPDTGNSEHVALLVQRILGAIADVAASDDAPSQTDVVQALTIATALRAAFAEVSARAGTDLTMDLLEIAVDEPDRPRWAA